jgi:hypothetical protein
MKTDEQVWQDIAEVGLNSRYGRPNGSESSDYALGWDQGVERFAEWLAENYFPPASKSGGEELPE